MGEVDGEIPSEMTSVKTFNGKKQIFVEKGTTWTPEFKSFLLALQKNLPEGSGKLSVMWKNALADGNIAVTHQKKVTQSVTIESYDTNLFVVLANSLAGTMMSWPGMSKLEAGHVAKSTVGAIVGSLETAGGDHGLYCAKDALAESYEFCLGIASEDEGDMVFQAFEISMSNSLSSWSVLWGLASGQTEKFKISLERVTFVK